MKASIVLALPFLALSAAAPAKLDERQPVKVPKLDPDVQCPIQIAKAIHVCFLDVVAGDPIGLTEINRWCDIFKEIPLPKSKVLTEYLQSHETLEV
ncbi:hypothetical protein ACHAPU_010497 [Fusarium lateritium]